MPPISVMIKPASGLCNMRCRYCFYADEASNRETPSYGVMLPEVQEAVLRRILEFSRGDCTIAFQGGEPTMAGLDFFRRTVELEQKWNVNGCAIHNAIQTNGYVIDDEWASFFAENHFLVGLSLDGPEVIHNANRVDAGGNGTYSRVMEAIRILEKHHVDFNILTVVTTLTAKNVQKIYHFFVSSGLKYQQYIPCLDPIGEKRGCHPYSLTPEKFERFLKGLFDCWYQDTLAGKQIYNRYFENLLLIMAGRQPEACDMQGACGRQYVVEADGSVYPCDFYVLDQWRLGNLVTDSFEKIEQKRTELRFMELGTLAHPDCLKCKWRVLCRGGCRRDREPFSENQPGKNYFCTAYYHFFEYAYPRLCTLLKQS